MRVFVTGASGWIGSATVTELIDAGHDVIGLARSDGAAEIVAALGAEVLRGDLADLDTLRSGAEKSDAVIHLGYNHDFSQMDAAAGTDRAVIEAIGAVLAGTHRPFLVASGVAGLTDGRTATEDDRPTVGTHPRVANAEVALALADQDVQPVVVRFAPTVHGAGDHGFVARLVAIARERGVSAYVGDGANRWPAVHRRDAAALVRLSMQNPAAASVVHAVAEAGIATRDIAEAIGRGLDLPVRSVPSEGAAEHFGWLGMFFARDMPSSSELTRERLDWQPAQPGLIADLDAGHYFATSDS
jgi:nucleoside-diphosphate-sugar epimerase